MYISGFFWWLKVGVEFIEVGVIGNYELVDMRVGI